MVFRPRDEDSIYETLKEKLTGSIGSLTNFVEGSFNAVWTRAFAQSIRENEIQAAAAQLSGWVDYAGGPITQSDLEDLNMENVSPEEINQYVYEEDLDQLVRLVGITRNPGNRATGMVRMETNGSTIVDEGTVVGTRPNSRGEFLQYSTTETVESVSDEDIMVNVRAEEVGERYNIDPGTIVYMPNPPAGVESVVNTTAMTGGVDRENNSELRERAKEAVYTTTGGGTTDGIRGYIQNNADVHDVYIDEDLSRDPPYVDVIVDGGQRSTVEDAIEASRPVGIQHNLVRPTRFLIDIEIDVEGEGVNETRVTNRLTQYVSSLGVSDNLYRDKIIQTTLNADVDAINIDDLKIDVNGETHTYEEDKNVYQIRMHRYMEQEENVLEIRGQYDGELYTFDKGVDFDVVQDGKNHLSAIDWSPDGATPDNGTLFYVDYRIENDLEVGLRQKVVPYDIDFPE